MVLLELSPSNVVSCLASSGEGRNHLDFAGSLGGMWEQANGLKEAEENPSLAGSSTTRFQMGDGWEGEMEFLLDRASGTLALCFFQDNISLSDFCSSSLVMAAKDPCKKHACEIQKCLQGKWLLLIL